MKLLGIDYGTKRIGLAISDEGMRFAFPKRVIENNINVLDEIGKIIKEEKIFQIVIGDSVNTDGSPNKISGEIDNFINDLGHKFNLPVRKEKEFFTTVEARGRTGKESLNARQVKKETGERVDASAAALILQRFIEKRNQIGE